MKDSSCTKPIFAAVGCLLAACSSNAGSNSAEPSGFADRSASSAVGSPAALDASASTSSVDSGGAWARDASSPLPSSQNLLGAGAGECDAGDAGCTTGGRAPACPDGGGTTVSGTVYDPAGVDPLYNVTVYVPVGPLAPLPRGASCDSCSALFPSTIAASAVTDAKGHFTMSNVPPGDVTLVVQTGKWRMAYANVHVTACADNPQPDKSLHLPRSAAEGDLPDIAISTGGADSFECLPLRLGVDAAEYVPGASTSGHIHVFQGYEGATTDPAAPESYASLWDSTADLMKNDVVILSCEGDEAAHVTSANRQSLYDYAAGGGRVFASHFHYSWLDTGPFGDANLATWTTGSQYLDDTMSYDGDPVSTLSNGKAFPEGQALAAWLDNVHALTAGKLPIWFARVNASVTAANTASQPWITLDPATPAPGAAQYFSVDMPIGGTQACGRVVYSDLHVSGGPSADVPGVPPDYPGSDVGGIVPSGCASHPLTPQEKALEFMLFDLSSCLIPVGQPPPPPPTPR